MNLFKSKITEAEQSLVKLQTEFDSLNEQFEVSRNEAVSLSEQLATMTSEFNRVNQENQELKTQLESKDAEILEVVETVVDVDVLANEKAITILANAGVPAVDVIEEQPEPESILDQFKTLKGKEQTEFYNQNKKAIMDALRNNH